MNRARRLAVALVGAAAATGMLAPVAGAGYKSTSKGCALGHIVTYTQNGTWQYHQVGSSGWWTGGNSLFADWPNYSSATVTLQNDSSNWVWSIGCQW